MSVALFTGWAPTLAFSPIDNELAEGIAKKWCSKFDWSLMNVIGLQSFDCFFLNRSATQLQAPMDSRFPFGKRLALRALKHFTFYFAG